MTTFVQADIKQYRQVSGVEQVSVMAECPHCGTWALLAGTAVHTCVGCGKKLALTVSPVLWVEQDPDDLAPAIP